MPLKVSVAAPVLSAAIQTLVEATPVPNVGLPDEIFYFISRTTPLVNVDLLIQDERGRTLLAWRDDVYAGHGWHVPGGIVRFQETFEERIRQVALREIGTAVDFDPEPIGIHEMIHRDQQLRGHFISLFYRCRLDGSFVPDNTGKSPRDAGYLQWHDECPNDMILFHEVYRKYMSVGLSA